MDKLTIYKFNLIIRDYAPEAPKMVFSATFSIRISVPTCLHQ